MYHSEKYTQFFIKSILKFYRRLFNNFNLTELKFEKISLNSANQKERDEYFELGRSVFTILGFILFLPGVLLGVASIVLLKGTNPILFISILLYMIPIIIGASFRFKISKNLKNIQSYTIKNLLLSILYSIILSLFSYYLLASGLNPLLAT